MSIQVKVTIKKHFLSIAIFLLSLNLSIHATAADWHDRFSNGVYQFEGGKYSINSPIPNGMCLDIKENNDNPSDKGAQFIECHGYIQAQYIASLISTPEIDEKVFIDATLKNEIPSYLNDIFSPVAKAELISKEITTINNHKAIFFSGVANLPTGKTRVLSARVLLDNKTILSASVISTLDASKYANEPKNLPDERANNPDAVERVFTTFIKSIKNTAAGK